MEEYTTVTCECGREVRVRTSLMGDIIPCPECGASIRAPGGGQKAFGPPCPHCGKPWPPREPRCPSCLARTRQRREKKTLSQRAEERKNSYAGTVYEEDSEDRPVYTDATEKELATNRVKHFYEKPTILGWPIAAGIMAVIALIALLRARHIGQWNPPSIALTSVGALAALVAIGLWRGSSSARAVMLALPVLAAGGALAAILCIVPEAMTASDMIACGILLVLTLAGLSLLTAMHGRLGMVIVGAPLAVVCLIWLWTSLERVGPKAQDCYLVAQKLKESVQQLSISTSQPVVKGLEEEPRKPESPAVAPVADASTQLADSQPTAPTQAVAVAPGAPSEPAAEAVAPRVAPVETNQTLPSPSAAGNPVVAQAPPVSPAPPAATIAAVTPAKPSAPAPVVVAAVPALPTPTTAGVSPPPAPAAQAAPANVTDSGAKPAPAANSVDTVADWKASMAKHGFEVAFADEAAVKGLETNRSLPPGAVKVTKYSCEQDTSVCAALVYEVAGDDAGGQALINTAADTAQIAGGIIDFQNWRAGTGPKVRHVTLHLRIDNQGWTGRIEARVLGKSVLVLAGINKSSSSTGGGVVNRFFTSLRIDGKPVK